MLTVTVTQDHISNGRPGSTAICPICLAIKEVVGHNDVLVYDADVVIAGKKVELPKKIREYIRLMDNKGKVPPISFEIDYDLPSV